MELSDTSWSCCLFEIVQQLVSYKAPLNLFQNVPVFQLQYGKAATLPFVQPSSINEWFLLTNRDDGSLKATIYSRPWQSHDVYKMLNNLGEDYQDNNVTNLTKFNYKLNCTELVMAYPQLQRLNLKDNRNLRIEDLEVIATCCKD